MSLVEGLRETFGLSSSGPSPRLVFEPARSASEALRADVYCLSEDGRSATFSVLESTGWTMHTSSGEGGKFFVRFVQRDKNGQTDFSVAVSDDGSESEPQRCSGSWVFQVLKSGRCEHC